MKRPPDRQKRQLSGELVLAEVCQRPAGIPISRPRGSKAEGLRYEKALAEAIGFQATRGQWFHFADNNGNGFCQPDLLLARADMVFVIECKLSWVPEALESLQRLYLPIVEKALGKEARGIVACENLRRGIPWTTRTVSSLDEAIASSAWPGSVVLHWRRGWPLRHRQEAA